MKKINYSLNFENSSSLIISIKLQHQKLQTNYNNKIPIILVQIVLYISKATLHYRWNQIYNYNYTCCIHTPHNYSVVFDIMYE